jgi:hypothetical protein
MIAIQRWGRTVRYLCMGLIAASALSSLGVVHAASALAAVQAAFQRYQQLERTFDPALAELYADDAVVWMTRHHPDGRVGQLKIPGAIYRQFLRQSMAEARARGDYNAYTDVRYRAEGDGVRVTAVRRSLWRHYRSPYSALWTEVRPGKWCIVEERLVQQVPRR